jgi:hypothetical protein
MDGRSGTASSGIEARSEPKDLGDIRFLVSRHRPDLGKVREIIAGFEPRARQAATENLVYLDVIES